MRLKIIREDESIVHLGLQGRLDVKGVTDIQYEFLQRTTWVPKRTIVDLSEVSYVASFGISMLVSAARELERKGGKLVLSNPNPLVRKTIETSGLHGIVPLVAGETAAMELLR